MIIMAIKSPRYGCTFPMNSEEGNYNNQNISEISVIKAIVRPFHPNRQAIARNQISHLIKKIKMHPEKKMLYVNLIKKLVKFELKQNGVKNE